MNQYPFEISIESILPNHWFSNKMEELPSVITPVTFSNNGETKF